MKKYILAFAFLIFLVNSSYAQDCYRTFYDAGVAAFESFDFEKAINQFKAAKICDDVPANNEIEAWIEKSQNGYIDAIKKERTKAQSLALTARSILELQKNDNATKAYQYAKYALEMDDNNDSRAAFYDCFYQLESNRRRHFYVRDVDVFNSVEDEIRTIDFIDNGQTIFVSNGRQDSISLFDFDGKKIADLPDEGYWFTKEAYSNETGMLLVSGKTVGNKYKVYGYRLKDKQLSDQPVFEYESPDKGVEALAISKDGKFIVASFNKGQVHILNAKGEFLYALEKENETAKYLSFSDNYGLGLAYGSKVKVVKLGPSNYETLLTHKEALIWDMKVKLSPKGSYVMIAGGKKARMLSITGDSLAYGDKLNSQMDIGDFSRDEKLATFGLQLLHMADKRFLGNFPREVRNMKFSPDANLLAANINDSKARIWKDRSYQESDFGVLGGHSSPINQLNFSSDNTHLVAGAMDNTFKIWNARMSAATEIFEAGTLLHTMLIEDSLAILTKKENELFVWNEKGKLKRNLKFPVKKIISIAENGKYLFVNGTDGNSIEVWNLDFENNKFDFEYGISGTKGADIGAINSDEKAVFFKSADNTLNFQVWDIKKGKTYFLNGYSDRIKVVKWSPDNKRIAALTTYGKVLVYNVSGGFENIILENQWRHANRDNVNGMSFSNDGKYIITSGQDYLTKIWTIQGDLVKVLREHTFEANSANYSPDGKYIITASEDRTAKVWSAEGDLLVTLEGYDSDVKNAMFSQDGRYIITNYGNKTIKIWPFDPQLIKDYFAPFNLPDLSPKVKAKYGVE